MRRFQIFDAGSAYRYIVVARLKQIERKDYVRHASNFFGPIVLNLISGQCIEHRSPAIPLNPALFEPLYSRDSQCTRSQRW